MADVKAVQAFWDANPCGSNLSERTNRHEYFDEIERYRYAHESHIPLIAHFGDFRGKRVLEIGTGIGCDGLQFKKNGAEYVGIDLTLQGQKLTREHFDLAGKDSDLTVGNAEELPLADGTFDHIYSFGVIHHSPLTSSIVDEMYRVLRPGGTFCVMVYNRTSINYYVEIMFLRKLFRHLLRPEFMPAVISKLLRLDREKLDLHRKMMLSERKPSREKWISMNTDGPECPLAKVYGKQEALELFERFTDVRTEVWFFDRTHWPLIGRLLPNAASNAIGRRWGWHRVVTGRKPKH